MGKYNASPLVDDLVRSARAAACVLALAVGGCAYQPPAVESAPAAPPAIDTRADDVRPAASVGEAMAAAGDLSLRDDAPLRYVVKRGDTLWGIANYFLRDAWQWPEFWYGNQQIRNPHLIYPGQVLRIVMVNGRPRLAVERVSPQIRELPLDEALPAIPIDAIRNFLKGPRVVSAEEIEKAPYVVAFTDDHVVAGANDGIYVKKLPADVAAGWDVVQMGEAYRDPDTDDLLGYEAIPAGAAELVRSGPVAEMMLTKSVREIIIGDRLLPLEAENFQANFYPHAPRTAVDGRIISVYEGVSQITQYQIVAMNRGSDHGLDPGTVLSIYQAGRKVRDPYGSGSVDLPENYAGVLMVFKVSPRLSYGLVMSATRPVHKLDKVKKPVPGQR